VIFSEPDRTQYDVNFRLFGVPVRIHPMFWILSLIMAGSVRPPSLAVVWVIAVLISVTIHELGHVMAFRRYGIHSYIVLHSFGGLAIPSGQSGYGNYNRVRLRPWENIVVSFAGPAVQMLSAFVLLGVLWAAGSQIEFLYSGLLRFLPSVTTTSSYLDEFVADYLYISIFWALINLLPIIPLDGGRISQTMFEVADSRTGTRQALVMSMIVSGLTGALMFFQFGQLFVLIFFVYLGAMNYQTLKSMTYGGGW